MIQAIGWLAATILLLLFEASTFNLVSIWFAAGSAAALITCLFTGSLRVQSAVFVAVSILCLLAFRPLVRRLRRPHAPTNGDLNSSSSLSRSKRPSTQPDLYERSVTPMSIASAVMFFLILALILVVVVIVVTNIVIVPQSTVFVIERLGVYSATWDAGLHVKIPFIERVAKKVSLKEQVGDFPPQPVITRDNVTIQIDTVVFFQVMDAKLYTYGVNQPIAALESLCATTLRNIIGEMELDHTLSSRDVINSKITAILDEATDKWGIKVNRVEVKNIMPPAEIQDAMEKQMKAEREKRAVILKAEGEKQAAITAAEGEKEAAILRADAIKQQRILEAEGEAQAILAVQQAEADAIRLLNEANPEGKVIALRSLDALAKVANGKATKIIIPSELQNLGAVVPSIAELLTDPKAAE